MDEICWPTYAPLDTGPAVACAAQAEPDCESQYPLPPEPTVAEDHHSYFM